MPSESAQQAHQRAAQAARRAYARLLGMLVARTGDIEDSEDALGEAFARALESWPRDGTPREPEAWLLTTARHAASDARRRQRVARRVLDELAHAWPARATAEDDHALTDETLRMLFLCAHPSLEQGIRPALMLQCVLGVDCATIASAFLVRPSTLAQRLVRAKRQIQETRVELSLPPQSDLSERLEAVLDALYAAFLAGWEFVGAPSRPDDLPPQAIALAGELQRVFPADPEVSGCLALMLFSESRREARRDAAGDYVPLDRQDPAAWNLGMITRAEQLLLEASRARHIGRYQLEAAIQSAHIHGVRTGRPDWEAILALYEVLVKTSPGPGSAVAQAAAVLRAKGPGPAQALLDEALRVYGASAGLAAYQPYWVARFWISRALGDTEQARSCLTTSIGLTPDPAVRSFLSRCWGEQSGPPAPAGALADPGPRTPDVA
ncbi:MAG: RNA polymerase subunit sigma-70 [Tepidisphaera sp.]|nr:RNA polymerase subunit sigma-70 [Tepidisphaera sp.]